MKSAFKSAGDACGTTTELKKSEQTLTFSLNTKSHDGGSACPKMCTTVEAARNCRLWHDGCIKVQELDRLFGLHEMAMDKELLDYQERPEMEHVAGGTCIMFKWNWAPYFGEFCATWMIAPQLVRFLYHGKCKSEGYHVLQAFPAKTPPTFDERRKVFAKALQRLFNSHRHDRKKWAQWKDDCIEKGRDKFREISIDLQYRRNSTEEPWKWEWYSDDIN